MSIFPALLMVHLVALVLMVGTSLIDFLMYRQFWKFFDNQKEKAAGILAATARFPKIISMGAGLLILSGISMIILTHGLLAMQLWFRIKIFFVLFLIVNGIYNGTRLGVKLRKIISMDQPDMIPKALHLKNKLRTFYLMQLCVFLVVIFLSAYKFD